MTQGEYIKKYRKEKGMTQAELALACNTAEGTIYQYEQGKRTPKTEILFRIADVLGVTAYDLQDDRFRNPDNSVSTFYSALQESIKRDQAVKLSCDEVLCSPKKETLCNKISELIDELTSLLKSMEEIT